MERKMLINAVHPEECRIAIIEGQELIELEIESSIGKQQRGNIYRAEISRIEPSLQAAFLDIGSDRNGFLQINDIHPSYFKPYSGNDDFYKGRPPIQKVLEPGQKLVVQVVKEERGLKGATLTTYLSLPGRYVVLMPGSEKAGISRKINDYEQRKRLKALADELEIPAGMGLIIRTAGLDRSHAELSRDLALQLKLWEEILSKVQDASCPTLLYEESDLATRVVRDYFTPEIMEILIDNELTFDRVKNFIATAMPRYRSRVKLFKDETPIFTYFGIDEQVEDTLKPRVSLPSGGEIVIDTLEALVAIDVNSGKATAGSTIEETAYITNLEAAEEIARQLRLRDLGGLIVVDFIDMLDRRHRHDVERKIRESVQLDKARVEVGRLSRFGLLEMSRQRLKSSLSSQSHLKCSYCDGTGKIKNPEIVALETLRKIKGVVVTGDVSVIKVKLSPAPALFLLNNKKRDLSELEQSYDCRILILPDSKVHPDKHQFEIDSRKDEHAQIAEEISERQKRSPLKEDNQNTEELEPQRLFNEEEEDGKDSYLNSSEEDLNSKDKTLKEGSKDGSATDKEEVASNKEAAI